MLYINVRIHSFIHSLAGQLLYVSESVIVSKVVVVVRDADGGSHINQNDVRRPILCRRRTTCLEQSTGVTSRPNTINYCLF